MKNSDFTKLDLALLACVLVAVLGILVSMFFMFRVSGSSHVWGWVFAFSFLAVPFFMAVADCLQGSSK